MTPTHPERELVALLELSERATPGIWEMYGGTNHARVQTADVIVCDGSPPHFMGKEDAKFIAALVNWFRSPRAATVPQGVWLPIESAPKDGSVVLAWRFYPVAIKWTGDPEYPWEAVNLGSHPSTTLYSNGFMEADCNLTHWQPLPTPPPAELGKES